MYAFFVRTANDGFFLQIRRILRAIATKFEESRVSFKEVDPDEINKVNDVMLLLQSMCENHYHLMQDLVRTQVYSTARDFNIVEEAIMFLDVVAKDAGIISNMSEEEMGMCHCVLDFLIECTQGPCEDNQNEIADSAMPTICSRIFEAAVPAANIEQMVLLQELKSNCCTLLVAMLEKESDEVCQNLAKAFNMDLYRFRLQTLQKQLNYDEDDMAEKMNNPAFDKPKVRKKYRKLIVNEAFDLLSITSDLQAVNKRVRERREPARKPKSDEEKKYGKAFKYFQARTRSIEVNWGGSIEKVFFEAPPWAASLTSDSKEKFMQNVDMTTREVKLGEFMRICKRFHQEMTYLHWVSKSSLFKVLSENFSSIKKGGYLFAVLINLILLLAYLEGSEDFASGRLEDFLTVLGVINALQYGTLTLVLLIQRGPMIAWQTKQDQIEADNEDEEEESLLSRIFGVFVPVSMRPLFASSTFVIVFFCIMSEAAYGDVDVSKAMERFPAFLLVSLIVLGLMGISGLRKYFAAAALKAEKSESAGGKILNAIILPLKPWLMFYDAFTDGKTLAHAIFLTCTLLGFVFSKSFYVARRSSAEHLIATKALRRTATAWILIVAQCSAIPRQVLIFDYVLMSNNAQNVIKAVTQPLAQLTATGALMFMTILMGSMIGFKFFQDNYEAQQQGECIDFLHCFISTSYVGFINSGQLSSKLGNLPPDDPMWAPRLLFDFVFFIIVGVLLFSMVSGIIIDTFSSIREESAQREDTLRNVCFICGMSRSEYAEKAASMGPRFTFKRHLAQHKWENYVLYLSYLQKKDHAEMTGVDSFVLQQVATSNRRWIPHKMSWALQNLAAQEEDEADIVGVVERLKKNVESQFSTIADLCTKMSEQMAAFDKRFTAMERRALEHGDD